MKYLFIAISSSLLYLIQMVSSSTPTTVPSLNLEQYTGQWYQVYANILSTYVTEKGGSCVTATYTLCQDPDTKGVYLDVLNEELDFFGNYNFIHGIANTTTEPGQLLVSFDNVPAPGKYWIYELGPVLDDQYQYSVVSDPQLISLFVLARNVDNFKQSYKQDVLTFVEQLGFHILLETNQSNCTYQERVI